MHIECHPGLSLSHVGTPMIAVGAQANPEPLNPRTSCAGADPHNRTGQARRKDRPAIRSRRVRGSGTAFTPMARTNRGTLIAQAAWWARAGELELASEAFRDAFAALLDRPVAVVATVQSASHSFTDALKRRRDVETLRVATTNRNELPELLAALLRNAR
jgi:hypothetical protein